ncbi:O-Antigen ligase [Poriferisphaera corsica]|uniref:O-Antigen ligase n=1 Tax=Poriferisphaera corsica TaxID=2528020 RepID=A0A517YUP9_9BACT|nr:O-antigen ligase family protein [Poriferisphaera corsica]QDU33969.1 O-Antigen ligase [Poriferisphaera corsica]
MNKIAALTTTFLIAGLLAVLLLFWHGQPAKQMIFMLGVTIACGFAAFKVPFWGFFLYYFFAVLRPQNLWEWALPGGIRWSLFASLIALGGVALHYNKIFKNGQVTGMFRLMVMFAILIFISIVLAYDPMVAQRWGIDYAKIFVIAILMLFIVNEVWQVRALATMIGLSIGYIAWEINYLYFFQNGRLDILNYGYGGYDNNGAALLIAMGMPFAYYIGVCKWERFPKLSLVFGGCIGTLMLHAVMMSYSRGAMVASLVGIVWVILRHRSKAQSAIIIAILVVITSVLAGNQIRDRIVSTANYQQDASAQSRFEAWGAAWKIAWDHPFFGQGVRNSNLFSLNYGADRAGRTIHNQYLQIAADSGIPAMIVFIMMIVMSLHNLGMTRNRCIRHIKYDLSSDSSKNKLDHIEKICLATQGSLIIFAIDSMFLSLELFELPWLLFILAGVIGIITSPVINASAVENMNAIKSMSKNPVRVPPRKKRHLQKKSKRTDKTDPIILPGYLSTE